MKNKKLFTTHIDTGGHGYYSVSKSDIKKLGIQNRITGYSGHTLTRCYLEEDQDGTLLHVVCKELGIELVVKSGYNLKFGITHNYSPQLFDYAPKPGDIINERYYVVNIYNSKILTTDIKINDRLTVIPLSNPFKYILSVSRGGKIIATNESFNRRAVSCSE